jgi:Trypsin-co-occurring domain 1
VTNSAVWVETVEFDVAGGRQVSSRRRARELLQERRSEIEAAIGEAAGIVRAAADKTPDEAGWRTTSVEATFGITVAAETGVVLTKASAEASLEIKITIERR